MRVCCLRLTHRTVLCTITIPGFSSGGNPVAIEKCSAAIRKKLVALDSDPSYKVGAFLLIT